MRRRLSHKKTHNFHFFFVLAFRASGEPSLVQLHAGGVLHFSLGSSQKVLPPNSHAAWITASAGWFLIKYLLLSFSLHLYLHYIMFPTRTHILYYKSSKNFSSMNMISCSFTICLRQPTNKSKFIPNLDTLI